MFKCEVPNECLTNEDIKLLVVRLGLAKGDSLNWEKTVNSKGVASVKYQVIRQKHANLNDVKSVKDTSKDRVTKAPEAAASVKHSNEKEVPEKAKSHIKEKDPKLDKEKVKEKAKSKLRHPETKSTVAEELSHTSRKLTKPRKRSSSSVRSKKSGRSGFLKNIGKKPSINLSKHTDFTKHSKRRKIESSDSEEDEDETEETSSNNLYRIVETKIDSLHDIYGVKQSILAQRWLELGNFDLLIKEVHSETLHTGKPIVAEI